MGTQYAQSCARNDPATFLRSIVGPDLRPAISLAACTARAPQTGLSPLCAGGHGLARGLFVRPLRVAASSEGRHCVLTARQKLADAHSRCICSIVSTRFAEPYTLLRLISQHVRRAHLLCCREQGYAAEKLGSLFCALHISKVQSTPVRRLIEV